MSIYKCIQFIIRFTSYYSIYKFIIRFTSNIFMRARMKVIFSCVPSAHHSIYKQRSTSYWKCPNFCPKRKLSNLCQFSTVLNVYIVEIMRLMLQILVACSCAWNYRRFTNAYELSAAIVSKFISSNFQTMHSIAIFQTITHVWFHAFAAGFCVLTIWLAILCCFYSASYW